MIDLKEYKGIDRIIHAEEKRLEIEEQRKNVPLFLAHTSILPLDECLGGFRKGWLVVVSGPPKAGKTSLCQTFTKRFIEEGLKCLWFSYELPYEELFDKFPSEKLDFYVPNYMESGNLEWIEKKIIESKQKFDTDIVFIDNLDFLRDFNVLKGVNLNLASYVGGIVQRIKSIAMKERMLIFLMSHIRKNEWTSKDLPASEELRDTGQIAQLADIVLMIMRRRAKRDINLEEIYDSNRAVMGIIENRHNGKTKKINLVFDKEFKEEYGYIEPKEQNTW